MKSWAAMSSFRSPWASSPSTSRSRSVSWSMRSWASRRASRSRATLGRRRASAARSIRISPAAAAFRAPRNSSTPSVLRRNPEAPASTASTKRRSSSRAVMTTTLVAGEDSLIRRVASMPLMVPRNSMSISTTSGRCSTTTATASSEVCTGGSSVNPGSWPTTSVRVSVSSRWSSQISSRIARRAASFTATLVPLSAIPGSWYISAGEAPHHKPGISEPGTNIRDMAKRPDPELRAVEAQVALTLTVDDFEAAARDVLPEMVFDYYAGGSGEEWTLRENTRAYGRWVIRPRVLVDVSNVEPMTTVLGQELPSPILLAPTAFQRMAHRDGELATARGAASLGAIMVVSTIATVSLEDLAATGVRRWFQLYVLKDRDLTAALVKRAEAAEGRIEVLLDGGIRRGSDVFKALALGARAILVGRPYLWGLAVNGADGVRQVLEIVRDDLMLTMALAGRPRIVDIDRSAVAPAPAARERGEEP